MPGSYLTRTRLAFKLSEIIQAMEEDNVAKKVFLSDLVNIKTNDEELGQLVDRIRSKLAPGPKNDRNNKWKDVLTDLLSEKTSEEAQAFVKELSDLLD